jgi:phosphoribosyl 1,2-cyclic phosphodiesterase
MSKGKDDVAEKNVRLVILGSRGSIPVSGSDFVMYGGGTTSFALVADDRVVGFIDAGTGIVPWRDFCPSVAPSIELFLTHYHWDHIQGLTMLDLVWSDDYEITIHGPNDPSAALTSAIAPPWFPVSLSDAPSMRFESIVGPVELAGLMITPFGVEHPQGAVGYRIDGPSSSVAIVTDHEAGSAMDGPIVDAIRGVEVLIQDGQYQLDEVETHRGWGHSTWEDAVAAALLSGANRLILTSLDPQRTDNGVDVLVHAARRDFHSTEAAYPGLSVSL